MLNCNRSKINCNRYRSGNAASAVGCNARLLVGILHSLDHMMISFLDALRDVLGRLICVLGHLFSPLDEPLFLGWRRGVVKLHRRVASIRDIWCLCGVGRLWIQLHAGCIKPPQSQSSFHHKLAFTRFCHRKSEKANAIASSFRSSDHKSQCMLPSFVPHFGVSKPSSDNLVFQGAPLRIWELKSKTLTNSTVSPWLGFFLFIWLFWGDWLASPIEAHKL